MIGIICDAEFDSEQSVRVEDVAGFGEGLFAGLEEREGAFVVVWRQFVAKGAMFFVPD